MAYDTQLTVLPDSAVAAIDKLTPEFKFGTYLKTLVEQLNANGAGQNLETMGGAGLPTYEDASEASAHLTAG